VAVVGRRTGFTTTVDALDLREGGELAYTMTATAPEDDRVRPSSSPRC
jgi:hypothetical protein